MNQIFTAPAVSGENRMNQNIDAAANPVYTVLRLMAG
jgi:hypothetical protein